MRRRFLKSCFSLGIVIVCLMGLLSSLSWYLSGNKTGRPTCFYSVPGTVLAPFLFTLHTSDFTYSPSTCHPQNLCDDSVILSLITDRVDKEWWTGVCRTKEMLKYFRRQKHAPPVLMSIQGRITQLLEDRKSPSSRPNCAQVAGETETFIWAHHQMESRLPLCHREITDKVNRSYAQTLEKKEDKSKI
ncbi:hypothetical protein D4764_18G0010790 [Takifugu flavidus]|uniref:Uncharacterized protein n=1 Tax=Takifugu flavidus TaxID=433684 RepID=A0A5C6NSI0_9TELE|nr:hypothetical protein D4764_18G0010790 [Takifugu flavidus]